MAGTPLPPIEVTPAQWRIIQAILHSHLPGVPVWAFGSRAKRQAKPYSDLDLAIVTDEPLGLHRMAAVAEAFSKSDLPWKVDLVDWASTSERFREVIRRDHVAL